MFWLQGSNEECLRGSWKNYPGKMEKNMWSHKNHKIIAKKCECYILKADSGSNLGPVILLRSSSKHRSNYS